MGLFFVDDCGIVLQSRLPLLFGRSNLQDSKTFFALDASDQTDSKARSHTLDPCHHSVCKCIIPPARQRIIISGFTLLHNCVGGTVYLIHTVSKKLKDCRH